MDWPCYQRACDRPERFSRWLLEQTRALLATAATAEVASRPLSPSSLDALDAALVTALGGAPLPKPADFKGGPALDMLTLDWPRTLAADALALVRWAQDADVRTPATRARGLGGFVEAWAEFERAASAVPTGDLSSRNKP